MTQILADLDNPLVFRTASSEVCQHALITGSLWLRSDRYYRELEDAARHDSHEGVNLARGGMPMHFPPLFRGIAVTIEGAGAIGQVMVPHYLACFHSTSITDEQRQSFGGHTFGVRNFSQLAAEIVYRCSLVLPVSGYRYGQVSYQQSALARQASVVGGSAIELPGTPPTYLNVLNTDVLRKSPVRPFIDQDEWRIAVFTKGYLDDNPSEPVRIQVNPFHFYPYLAPEGRTSTTSGSPVVLVG